MCKLLCIVICATFIYTCSAQETNIHSIADNRIAVNGGLVAFTDWKFGLWSEGGFSYSHVWYKHLSTSLNISLLDYGINGGPDYSIYHTSLPTGKKYFEGNLTAGYSILTKNERFEFDAGGGVSYRRRLEIYAGDYLSDVVWNYLAHEVGAVFYIRSDYMITDKVSLGLYAFEKLYPAKSEQVTLSSFHKSPNTFSYGLSAGFHF